MPDTTTLSSTSSLPSYLDQFVRDNLDLAREVTSRDIEESGLIEARRVAPWTEAQSAAFQGVRDLAADPMWEAPLSRARDTFAGIAEGGPVPMIGAPGAGGMSPPLAPGPGDRGGGVHLMVDPPGPATSVPVHGGGSLSPDAVSPDAVSPGAGSPGAVSAPPVSPGRPESGPPAVTGAGGVAGNYLRPGGGIDIDNSESFFGTVEGRETAHLRPGARQATLDANFDRMVLDDGLDGLGLRVGDQGLSLTSGGNTLANVQSLNQPMTMQLPDGRTARLRQTGAQSFELSGEGLAAQTIGPEAGADLSFGGVSDDGLAARLNGLGVRMDDLSASLANAPGAGGGAPHRHGHRGIDPGLEGYMNPYTNEVIDATTQRLQRELDQANAAVERSLPPGAYGGSRMAVAQAENAANTGETLATTIAGLNRDNYNQALSANQRAQQANQQAALQGVQDRLSAARALQSGAGIGQNLALQDADALFDLGQKQQAQQERALAEQYNDLSVTWNYPLDMLNTRLSAANGQPFSQTNAQETLTGSSFAQNLGAAASMVGTIGKHGDDLLKLGEDASGFLGDTFGSLSF